MNRIEVKLISTLNEMEELRPQWNRLLAASPAPTVFDTWEWQFLAAKMFSEDRHPTILTAYDGNEPVAILPLRQRRVKIGHLIPVSVWAPMGGSLTDYNALIVKEGYVAKVMPAFSHYLKQSGRPLDIENSRPGSPLDMLGGHLSENGWRSAVYESKTALVTELPEDHAAFLTSLKKKFRKTLRNNQNYMDRESGYTYQWDKPTEELLTALISLHTSRWQHKGESGALARQRIRDFHMALAGMENRPFSIDYYTIRHLNQIVAILYGFTFRNRFYAYLSGFDMAHTRISPGNMIINECIRCLINGGVKTFDMLRGDMKYKQTWATASFDMKDALYFPPGLSGGWLSLVMKTVLAIKRLLPASMKSRLKKLIGREMPETTTDD